MTFPIPSIDDIEFEQLVEEARALIPRYAPEWTDHNLHDPGITLLELLAWIVDQQIYQVGLVSNRYLYAFAALLGVRPKAAIPARGLIWPNKLPGNANKQVVLASAQLSRGEKVTCIQQPEISFVLDADINLTPANLIEDGIAVSVTKKINLSGFIQQPRSSFIFQPNNGSENFLEIAFDQPLVRKGEYPISLGIEVESFIPSIEAKAPTHWGPLFIEYMVDGLLPWRQVPVVEDGTFSLARTGVVLIKVPANDQDKKSRLRIRLDRGFYPLPIQIVRLELNVLPIVQLEEKPDQPIGRSNGFPDQVFSTELGGLPDQSIALSPMGIRNIEKNQSDTQSSRFPKPFTIEIAEVDHVEKWIQTDDLSTCKPSERVYQWDITGNKITFGNGVNGKIPRNDVQIQIKPYHTTNGTEGNLASGLDWRVPAAQVQGTHFGSNPQPVSGGENAWDIDRLMMETRKRVLGREVLLSNKDLQSKVQSLDGFGVARADVLPRYHPSLPDQELLGARTVVVTPWRNTSDMAIPEVQALYLTELAKMIEPSRVLGERLTVIAHQRVQIQIETTLLINTGKDDKKIRIEAIKQLKTRLTDIPIQGVNSKLWPLGRPVSAGEIKTLLSTIPDVIAVTACKLAREGEPYTEQDIRLNRDEVAIVSDRNIKITFLMSR